MRGREDLFNIARFDVCFLIFMVYFLYSDADFPTSRIISRASMRF